MEKIKNQELRRLITMKAHKLNFEDVTKEDFEVIENITINGYLIDGKQLNDNLKELLFFPNLKRLKISKFKLGIEDIEVILKLKNLEDIEIVNCDFKNIEFYKLNESIKSIKFINCQSLNFKYPEIEEIFIVGTNIDFKKINFINVKKVFVQNCIVKNAYNLNDYVSIEDVNLDGSKLYNESEELIEDILVSENTKYTHEKKVYYYDN